MRYLILSILGYFLFTGSATAESPYQSGLFFKNVGQEKQESGNKTLYVKKVHKPELAPSTGGRTEEENPETIIRIWEKYKELVTPQSVSSSETQTPESETKKEEPKPATPATGISGIIQQYNDNKTKGSKMRIRQVRKPKDEGGMPLAKPAQGAQMPQ